MSKKSNPKKLEGEGSYSGTRGYNAGLAEHLRHADVAGLAKKAARALDGPEAKQLKQAEKRGKQGPRGRARNASAR